MTYGKLINGNIISPPAYIEQNGRVIINPAGEQLFKAGYKPIIYTTPESEAPEGQMWIPHWEEVAHSEWGMIKNKIEQVWNLVPIPEPAPPEPVLPTLEERMETQEQINLEQDAALMELAGGMTNG